ncbi:hypothetical protein SprV_0301226200 [Sparganum proliferum]
MSPPARDAATSIELTLFADWSQSNLLLPAEKISATDCGAFARVLPVVFSVFMASQKLEQPEAMSVNSPVEHQVTMTGSPTEVLETALFKYIDPSTPPESDTPETSSLSLLVQTCDRIGRELGFGEFSKTLRSMVNDTPKPKPAFTPGPPRRLQSDAVTADTPSCRRQRSGQKRLKPLFMNGALSEWHSKVRRLQEINQLNVDAQGLRAPPAPGNQSAVDVRLLHSPYQQKAESPTDAHVFSALRAMDGDEEPVNLSKSSSLCTSPNAKEKTPEMSPQNCSLNDPKPSSPSTPTTSSYPRWDFDYWLRLFLLLPENPAKTASQLHCSAMKASDPLHKYSCIEANTSNQAVGRVDCEAPAYPQAPPSALLTQLLFLGSLLPCLLRSGTSGSAIQLADSEPAHRPTNAISQ